ncbi:MAG: DsbE family thiol:disulfide interchange protein [Candidatus Pacearchaeota archaeon]|nr:DsbE family thiol:disulfide interchange protein [Candidatus Pacearchaeota archaeon]
MNTQTIEPKKPRNVITWLIPLLIFIIISVFLGIGLTRDPRYVPSPLIDKPVPVFNFPAVQGRELGLSDKDLHGEVSLVNVFASWCVACREEHPFLMNLSRVGEIPIHGLNYKDEPPDAAAWLDQFGDPYTRTGADIDGRVGIDWGVYGVPETFVISKDGRIAHKHIGPITQQKWDETIQPIIQQLRKI